MSQMGRTRQLHDERANGRCRAQARLLLISGKGNIRKKSATDSLGHRWVLSVDEKSQIQALDRTKPGLPLKKGQARTMTHDYKRNGTTTLFAICRRNCQRALLWGKP